MKDTPYSLMREICILVENHAREKGFKNGDDWYIPLCNRIYEDIEQAIPSAKNMNIPDYTY